MKFTVRTVDVHLEVPFQISRAVRTEKRVVLVELDVAVNVGTEKELRRYAPHE